MSDQQLYIDCALIAWLGLSLWLCIESWDSRLWVRATLTANALAALVFFCAGFTL